MHITVLTIGHVTCSIYLTVTTVERLLMFLARREKYFLIRILFSIQRDSGE